MGEERDPSICPHCATRMRKWSNPDGSTWGDGFQRVCFNDNCPYFVNGWDWMNKTYAVKSSYRHRYNPATGGQGPIPVWSAHALKDGIIEDDPHE